jgi:predicted RNA-binding Zn-ribbon protein involved in translation (DUF1610 family)
MGSDNWKNLYAKGKQNRPGITEIMAFLPRGVGILFQEFSRHLSSEYDVGCKPPVYTEKDGWVYAFGRYDVHLLNHVTMEDGGFSVQGFLVSDETSLRKALALSASFYDDYRERFGRIVAIKKEKQKQGNQRRIAREKSQMEALSGMIDKERFNRYRWSPKISRQLLKKLYDSDAKGLADDELVDEVGYTLYARCLQGRDEGLLKNSGKLKCHNCGEILAAKSREALMECSCGQQYIFRDYMRSFREENMPSGAATAIFNAFIENWQHAKGYAEKMRLIDGLIHEFHINLNSGVKGRFVGINLIEGSKKQIGDLTLELAYGNGKE